MGQEGLHAVADKLPNLGLVGWRLNNDLADFAFDDLNLYGALGDVLVGQHRLGEVALDPVKRSHLGNTSAQFGQADGGLRPRSQKCLDVLGRYQLVACDDKRSDGYLGLSVVLGRKRWRIWGFLRLEPGLKSGCQNGIVLNLLLQAAGQILERDAAGLSMGRHCIQATQQQRGSSAEAPTELPAVQTIKEKLKTWNKPIHWANTKFYKFCNFSPSVINIASKDLTIVIYHQKLLQMINLKCLRTVRGP